MRKRVKNEKREVANSSLRPNKGISLGRGEITLVYIKGKKPYIKGEVVRIKKASHSFKGVSFGGIKRLSQRVKRFL